MDAKYPNEKCRRTRVALAVLAILLISQQCGFAAGYICAEGGGGLGKGTWARDVFQWMIEHGGERRVVVLGYHADEDKTVERVFLDNGAADVIHLTIADRATADLPQVAADIMSCDIIWMRGGDQSKYVLNWRGTRTENAIRAVYDRGGVIGGTSAGAAVLGEAIYDAFNGSLTSPEALTNAFHPVLTLTTGFLSLTPGVLFDTHFNERGRIGRLAVMLARRHEDAQQDLIGVGLDYRTALCVYPDLTAEVRGEGCVTILHRTDQTQQVLSRGRPPTITDLSWTSLTQGYRIDLKTRSVLKRPERATAAGRSDALPVFAACTVDGGLVDDRNAGSLVLDDGDDPRSLFEGRLSVSKGSGMLGHTLILTRAWDDDRRIENRAGGAVWVLAGKPGMLAILAGEGTQVTACEPAILSIRATQTNAASCLVFDSHEVEYVVLPKPVSQSNGVSPRQSAALESGRLHILTDGAYYNVRAHRPILARNPYDLNADGLVNKDDLRVFAALACGATASPWQREVADANRDRRIDRDDEAGFVEAMLDDISR